LQVRGPAAGPDRLAGEELAARGARAGADEGPLLREPQRRHPRVQRVARRARAGGQSLPALPRPQRHAAAVSVAALMGGRSPESVDEPPPSFLAPSALDIGLVALLVFAVLVANGRPIGAGDTRPTERVAASLVQSLDFDL